MDSDDSSPTEQAIGAVIAQLVHDGLVATGQVEDSND
jgi:hypothetical protein